MVPAFVVITIGVNSTWALAISQVTLLFALPIPMIALVIFTRRRDIMGEFTNNRLTDIVAIVGTAITFVLNAALLLQTFDVAIPSLPNG